MCNLPLLHRSHLGSGDDLLVSPAIVFFKQRAGLEMLTSDIRRSCEALEICCTLDIVRLGHSQSLKILMTCPYPAVKNVYIDAFSRILKSVLEHV